MRSSMRDGAGAGPRPRSMIQDAKSVPQKKGQNARPASAGNLTGPSVTASALAAASLQAQAGNKARVTASKPAVQMQNDDSDSESSFRKKRRQSTSTVDSMGRYNMRRSMRANSVDVTDRRPQSPTGPPKSSRWSVRSMSPPASNARSNLRQSMRRESIDDTPTMRGKNSKARARDSKSPTRLSIASFRASKPAPAPAPTSQSKSMFKSRFNNDSDDEQEPAPARSGFRSRFADSDDEADSPSGPSNFVQADLTPVRGIPRRKGQEDEDSTDLDDSDDDAPTRSSKRFGGRTKATPIIPSQSDIDKVMELARRNVAAQTLSLIHI